MNTSGRWRAPPWPPLRSNKGPHRHAAGRRIDEHGERSTVSKRWRLGKQRYDRGAIHFAVGRSRYRCDDRRPASAAGVRVLISTAEQPAIHTPWSAAKPSTELTANR